jgi:hypothetical protein
VRRITAWSWRSGNPSQRNGRAAPPPALPWQRREVGQGAWQPRSIGRPRLCDGARAQINVACRGWPDNDVRLPRPKQPRQVFAGCHRRVSCGRQILAAGTSQPEQCFREFCQKNFPCRGDNSFAKMPQPLGSGLGTSCGFENATLTGSLPAAASCPQRPPRATTGTLNFYTSTLSRIAKRTPGNTAA